MGIGGPRGGRAFGGNKGPWGIIGVCIKGTEGERGLLGVCKPWSRTCPE